jgi:hypothetical protein
MADVRKVISFSAVDTGVSQMFDKMRRLSATATDAVIGDAKKAGTALQQQWTEAAKRAAQQNIGTGRVTPTTRPLVARIKQAGTMFDNAALGDDTDGDFSRIPVGPGATFAGEAEPQLSLKDRKNRQFTKFLWRQRAAKRYAPKLRARYSDNDEDNGPTEAPETGEESKASLVAPGSAEAGLNAVSRKYKSPREQQAYEEADELVKEAMAFSDDVKKQTQFLRKRISEIRQNNAASLNEELVNNDVRLDGNLSKAGDDKEKIQKAKDSYRDKNQEIRKGQREDALQLKLLQGIIDAVHQSAVVETEAEKRNTESLVEESNESQEQQQEEDKGDDQQAADAETQAPTPRRRGFFGTMFGRIDAEDDPEEEGNEGSEGEESAEAVGRSGQKPKRNRRLAGGGLASQTSGALLSATGFAAFASIGGIIAKMIHEGGELEKNGGRMKGMTGVGYENYDLKGGASGWLGIGKSSDYGVKRSDFIAYSTDLAQKRGYATAGYDASGRTFNSGLENETNKLMSTEMGFGLSSGYLSGLGRHQSYDTNNRETSGDVQNLIKIMGSAGQFRGGDFSRLAELLETSNQIAEDQSGYLEQINSDKNAGIMAGVSRLGGSFADQRMGARISTLQGALRTPDNDFKQADAYAVLRRKNPQKNFFELQEEQDKGLGASGYMSGVMEDIMGRGGDDAFKMQMVKSRFGVSPSQARRMYEGYKKNPSVFNFDQYAKKTGGADIDTVARAKDVSAPIPIGLAKMDDVAAKAGDKTIKVLADMANWVGDKVPAIVDGMKSMSDAAAGAGKKLEALGSRADKVMNRIENLTHWGD